MWKRPAVVHWLLAALAVLGSSLAAGGDVSRPPDASIDAVIIERFQNLDQWRPLTFPKIKAHSSYIAQRDAEGTFLRAESHASASGIVSRKTFDVGRYHRMRWRWKVENVYEKGDGGTKAGDDYPIRVFVLFKYDPDRAGVLQRMQYGAAKLLFGEYPPQSSLNYVWANREGGAGILPSPYTDRQRMVILESGRGKVGRWIAEDVDLLRDYRRAFGREPPPEAGLGVMNDSDNTGEASVSYVADLEVYRSQADSGP